MQLSHLVALYATISSCPQCSATRLREIASAVPGPRHHFLTGIGWHHSWRLVGVLGQHLSRGIGRIRRQSADLPAHASRASTELDESRLNHLSTNGAAMPRAAGSAWSTCGQCSSWPRRVRKLLGCPLLVPQRTVDERQESWEARQSS